MFSTDKQTLDDLNIFGRHGTDSIFSLFNRCTTRGGATIMEEMFHYPLSNAAAINHRSDVIAYFSKNERSFPFNTALFDAIEPYLANTDERTRVSAQQQSLKQKLSGLISTDIETAIIRRGIVSLVELLVSIRSFMQSKEIGEASLLQQELQEIKVLFTEGGLDSIAYQASLSQEQMAAFDTLFRFRHRTVIQKILHHIYLIDVYIAAGKVAKDKGFSFPKALECGSLFLDLRGVYHPQVKNAVPNNICSTPDGNVLFLTGANMAGKSTFMKSLTIAMYLAHMGFPVAAAGVEFPVFDGIYTTINLPDNLGMGVSHFYAEVLRVKKIAGELSQGKKLFIVFDELFRGTNVKDAYEATIAITKGFAARNDSLFVISTHIIEAGDVLKATCPNVRFVYLPTRMDGSIPVYSYTLEGGITDDRHGMIIINNERILEILEAGIRKKKFL